MRSEGGAVISDVSVLGEDVWERGSLSPSVVRRGNQRLLSTSWRRVDLDLGIPSL